MKKIKKIIDTLVSNILCLSKQASKQASKQTYLCLRKGVQLFSNCTSSRKESEGLNLCSLFDLKNRGAFLC